MRTLLALLLILTVLPMQADRRGILLSKKPAAAGGGSFTPGDYGTVLAWLKADALSLSDNDPVVTWTDSGPNAFSPTNITASGSRPIYKANIVNGKPVVRFDGGDFLLWDALTGDAGTIFVVVGTVVYSAANAVLGPNLGVKRLVTFFPDAVTVFAGNSDELWGSAFTTWVDGAATSTFPANPAFALITQVANTPTDLGGFLVGDAVNDNFNGDIAEILIFEEALDTVPRQAVEAALMLKYGL